jgi:hypothetical protein
MDYDKLNLTTCKDYFSLPFMDQMLEILTGKSHYYFLEWYIGYNQIVIALKYQENTIFTCLFDTFAYRRMTFSLYNTLSTFERCMVSIFLDYI